jgi:4-amino-4-deoxy-L-arabinose transferase-like glycosyltransferase
MNMSAPAKAVANFAPRDGVGILPIKCSVGIGFAVLLLTAAYFSPHIWEHGEAREALVVQDILHSGRWILPLRNEELPSKPVFYHWVAAFFATLLGPSDFTMRIASVIGAALMLWLTCRLGALDSTAVTGLVAAGILGSTFEFWDSATEARVDMLFAALVGLSLTGWYLWYRSGAESARATAYVAAALAVLTKGPAGLLLPAIVIVTFAALERSFARLYAFLSWRWICLLLLIDLGWYAAAYERGGAEFWNKQIVYENFQRFIGTGDFETAKPRFSQGVWLMTQLFPWSVVLLLAFFGWLRGRRQEPVCRFLHIWWLSILFFFLLASGQRAVYLLAIYPAVAALTARELETWVASGRGRATGAFGFERSAAAVAFIALFNFCVALAVPISRTVQEDSSVQEQFVDDVIEKLPRTAKLYAAPDFPETTLLVLAYRLDRNILRRAAECEGKYYYFSASRAAPACGTGHSADVTMVAAAPHKALYLLHTTTREIQSRRVVSEQSKTTHP